MDHKKFNIHSIIVKYFTMIFIFIVLPILGFFLVARRSNINTLLTQKQSSDLVTLNTFSSTLTTYMNSVEAVSNIVSTDDNIKQFISTARDQAQNTGPKSYKSLDSRKYLEHYTSSLDSVLTMSLMDENGFFIGEKNLDLDRLTYYFNETMMKEIKGQGKIWTKTFSIEFNGDHSIRNVFALMVPVTEATGKLSGYVILFTDTQELNQLLEAYHDDIYVLEEESIIGSKRKLPMYTDLFAEMQISYGLLLEDSSVLIKQKGDSLIVTTQNYDPLDIQLLLASSYSDLKKEVTATFPTLLTFTIYGILFAAFASFVIARIQTKPIVSLQGIMNHVKEGDFNIRFQPKGKDEVTELGITFNSLLDRIQILMKEQKLHQKMKRKLELQIIQEQVNPHFLYNVLEMINSMIRCGMSREAMDSVESLANFYRISLNNGSNIIAVSQEIKLIENYMHLQKMRYMEFMDYILAFSPMIYEYTIPKLTLQPLVENALYHGIKEKENKGMLCVSGYLEQNRIVFEVYDTGKGISQEKLIEIYDAIENERDMHEQHFGISSVIKRLKLHYNDQVEYKIESTPGEYTCVTISFPAIKLNE